MFGWWSVIVSWYFSLPDSRTEFVGNWGSCPSQAAVGCVVDQIEQRPFGFRAEVCGKLGLMRPTRWVVVHSVLSWSVAVMVGRWCWCGVCCCCCCHRRSCRQSRKNAQIFRQVQVLLTLFLLTATVCNQEYGMCQDQCRKQYSSRLFHSKTYLCLQLEGHPNQLAA